MESNQTHEFFAAVRSNDIKRTRSLIQSNPSLVKVRILGDATLLNGQVWRNKSKIDVDIDEKRDTPALHYAVFHAHLDMAKLLLEYGTDVDALGYENNHEMTPSIVLAAWEGGIEVLRLLLENGADPNGKSSSGVTPLSTALRHNKIDRVELLKEHGAVT